MNRREFIASGAAGISALTGAEVEHAPLPGGFGVPGYDYRRPDFPKGMRLLFQGDSITDMKRGRNEKDRNHYLGHSYVFLIAARLETDMPETTLEFHNRGISGNRVADLRRRWKRDAIAIHPDLLSILIGVNDVWHTSDNTVDFAKWEEDYRFILEASRKANPKLKLVLIEPFILQCGHVADGKTYAHWRGQIDRMIGIVRKLAADYHAVRVPMQEVFDAAAKVAPPGHWIWDGVHPLPQGHELIARHWLLEVAKA